MKRLAVAGAGLGLGEGLGLGLPLGVGLGEGWGLLEPLTLPHPLRTAIQKQTKTRKA